MELVLGPDVLVNASVAGPSAPDQVAKRVLDPKGGKSKSSDWILDRVKAMLSQHPHFKNDALDAHISTIRGLVEIVEIGEHGPDSWKDALLATANKASVTRIITDHPDLLEEDGDGMDNDGDGIEFISTEAWLIEQQTPPPPPNT